MNITKIKQLVEEVNRYLSDDILCNFLEENDINYFDTVNGVRLVSVNGKKTEINGTGQYIMEANPYVIARFLSCSIKKKIDA